MVGTSLLDSDQIRNSRRLCNAPFFARIEIRIDDYHPPLQYGQFQIYITGRRITDHCFSTLIKTCEVHV